MSTIQEAFSSGIKKLSCLNNHNPQLDAKILLRHILDINNEKFEKSLNYKNLKKSLEKLI